MLDAVSRNSASDSSSILESSDLTLKVRIKRALKNWIQSPPAAYKVTPPQGSSRDLRFPCWRSASEKAFVSTELPPVWKQFESFEQLYAALLEFFSVSQAVELAKESKLTKV